MRFISYVRTYVFLRITHLIYSCKMVIKEKQTKKDTPIKEKRNFVRTYVYVYFGYVYIVFITNYFTLHFVPAFVND